MKDPDDKAFIKMLTKKLDDATPGGVTTHIVSEEKSDMSKTFNLLDMVFSLTIAIMMGLCFFSLVSSTTANLYD